MEYEYVKTRALNQKEKFRLRLSVRLGRQLRALDVDGIPEYLIEQQKKPRTKRQLSRTNDLMEALFDSLSFSSQRVNERALEWALCHVSARTLQKFISAFSHRWPQSGTLDLIKQADPSFLLLREHITPDFQLFQRTSIKPKTSLICFAGNAHRLNIPVQLFHILVVNTFDMIVYLRDDKLQRFIYGMPDFGTNLAELGETLSAFIPADCRTAILAVSSGGIAATRIAEQLNADRMALFSPEFTFKNISAINDNAGLTPENTLLFFATDNYGDLKVSENWKSSYLGDSIQWLNSTSHGTLAHFVYNNDFQALADWLACQDNYHHAP